MAILEILLFIMCISKNLMRMTNLGIGSEKKRDRQIRNLKMHYYLVLLLGGTTRAFTLMFLLGEPKGLFLYLLYSLPILFWLSSLSILLGFIALLYLQFLQKSDRSFRVATHLSGLFIGTHSLSPF